MKEKDRAYAEHLRQQQLDRPKDFGANVQSVAEYVTQWCVDNGLKHPGAEALKAKIKEARRKQRTAGPKGKLP